MLQSSPTQFVRWRPWSSVPDILYLDHLADCVQTRRSKMQLKSEIIQMVTTRSVKVQPPTTAGFRGGWRETKLLQKKSKDPHYHKYLVGSSRSAWMEKVFHWKKGNNFANTELVIPACFEKKCCHSAVIYWFGGSWRKRANMWSDAIGCHHNFSIKHVQWTLFTNFGTLKIQRELVMGCLSFTFQINAHYW